MTALNPLLDAFRAGGFNMWILTAIGAVLVVTAVRFARAATPQRLALIRALSWAQLASALLGFVSGLAATAMYVVRTEPSDPLPVLLTGFAESTANLSYGGLVLCLVWILIATGIRRMPNP